MLLQTRALVCLGARRLGKGGAVLPRAVVRDYSTHLAHLAPREELAGSSNDYSCLVVLFIPHAESSPPVSDGGVCFST